MLPPGHPLNRRRQITRERGRSRPPGRCASREADVTKKKKKDFPWRRQLSGSGYQLLRGARVWLHLRKTLTSARANLRQPYRKRVTKAQKSGDQCWGRGTTVLQSGVSSACGPDAMDTGRTGLGGGPCRLRQDGGHTDRAGTTLPLGSQRARGPLLALTVSISSP